MLKRSIHAIVLALAVAALFAGPVAAQPVDGKTLQAARELITVMRTTDQIRQIMPNIMEVLKPVIVQGRPEVEKDLDVVLPILLDGMNARVGEFVDQMATLYARNFTADELQQMTAFYRSPAGQKFLEKMPSIVQQSTALGQQFGQRVGAELQGKMIEEMRKRGHDVQVPKP